MYLFIENTLYICVCACVCEGGKGEYENPILTFDPT